jgi:LuxR family transcriptional regulator, maltose regulon positive regulatory protein
MAGALEAAIPEATPDGDPIMTAKFQIPAVPAWFVTRQRLINLLTGGTRGSLTVVSGPAGSGKTLLAGSWLARGAAPGPVAWITLEADDSRPGVFWAYILAGLARAGAPVAAIGRPAQPDAVDRSLLVRLAAALSSRPDPVVLVLDNAHVLTGGSVPEELDFLIRHAGPGLRVVALARGHPGLALHRYRVAGLVTEIGFDELAFTAAETRILLAAHGAQVTDTALVALTEHMRGWAAGLRLTARAMHRERVDDAGRWPDGRGELADYFRAEVLDTQPAAIREFLLHTSVVERLWPVLATELTGRRDAARILATLAHDNMFLTCAPDDPVSYEYHPVVRHLLRLELDREHPERLPALSRKAARWLAAAGRPAEALVHAGTAGDWEHAATLLVESLSIGRLLVGPQTRQLAETFSAMPPDLETPECAVVQAALALSTGDTESCAKHVLRAHELTDDHVTDRTWALRLSVLVTDVARAQACGQATEALAAAETANTTIAQMAGNGIPVPAELETMVLLGRGDGLAWNGDLACASRMFVKALHDPADPMAGHLQVACLGRLALIEALYGRLRRASDLARQAGIIADRFDLPADDRPPAAEVALAWVKADEYDLCAARAHADRAAAVLAVRPDPLSAGPLALVRARVLRARGDLAGAIEAVERAQRPAVESMPPWLTELLSVADAVLRAPGRAPDVTTAALAEAGTQRGRLARAAAALTGGDVLGAQQAASDLLRDADLPLDVRVDCWLLTATSELVREQPHLARAALERALNLAEAERLRRPMFDAPPRLRRFIRQDPAISERHAWLGTAVADTAELPATADAGSTTLVVEPLTARETEVLGYLAALFSTEEIARKMFVSVNTVKTHVRGVLRKLAASRRNEAVRRARELGLI